jgi:hypothetical protein
LDCGPADAGLPEHGLPGGVKVLYEKMRIPRLDLACGRIATDAFLQYIQRGEGAICVLQS